MPILTEDRPVLSPTRTLSLCILGSDPQYAESIGDNLERLGYPIFTTTNPQLALERIRSGQHRVVLAEMDMGEIDGLEFLRQALDADPGVYVILIGNEIPMEKAIEAVKQGAYDFLQKPIDWPRLERTLEHLRDEFGRRSNIRDLEDRLLSHLEFHGIVGRSPAIVDVFERVQKIARHFTNVLVVGPTGSGKELVAWALHKLSPVATQRFAVCNCSALVDTLLESQLFGHMRGAFTGATDTRPGLFEYANGGTVFLDEIGEMSLGMQSKLLRVIENREIQRVGSPEVKKVDVRLVAATNRDLRAEVMNGHFREDLFYRLSTLEVRVPSLAERIEDIPLLVQFFLKKYNQAYGKNVRGLTRAAQAVLLRYHWPGNVRELENVVSSTCLTVESNFIDVVDLPTHLQHPHAAALDLDEHWRPVALEEVKRQHIARVLEFCAGNRVRAAQILGIGRTSLYRYFKREGGQKPGHTGI
ncbi:MAG TPA: sigma-54 dependent transcriptional regulator [Candidatus Dormibacteraeota bacterium]|nr:sigma-54 dependent transcriptional regulator [Candidatus Dormibacteraeota bacterium]